MANVYDIASYILQRTGEITTWQLQKLVYYSQAWSLAWDDKPLFEERIESWSNGPVVPELFHQHQGHFYIAHLPKGNPDALDPLEKETVDAVLEHYASFDGETLKKLTHSEEPWQRARNWLPEEVPCNAEITHDLMKEYYRKRIQTLQQSGYERGGKFYLKCLLSQVTEDNRHEEIDFGEPVGKEWC